MEEIENKDMQKFEDVTKSQFLPRACCNIFVFTDKVNIFCRDDKNYTSQ